MIKSATAVSYELDDFDTAVVELVGQIKEKIELEKQGIGILYAQPDMDLGELSARLKTELGFDIIGGTTAIGAVMTDGGFHELGIALHVMTAEDCFFASAISPPLAEEHKTRVTDTYNEALSKLPRSRSDLPKMVFCIMTLMQDHSPEDSLSILGEVSAGLPVFGFVAADDFEFVKQQVFLNGVTGGDRMVLLLISGDIRPVFEVKNLAGSKSLSKRQITKSCGNVIYEIDGKPAYEYIKEFPFISEESGSLWNYQFFTEMRNELDNDGVSVARVLNSYDKESGHITCFANVPEGSFISLQYCDGEDVLDSCEKALAGLKVKIEAEEQNNYRYSAVFVSSCNIRNMFLADRKNAEGNLLKKMLPPGLTAAGAYTLGEIAPTSIRNSKAVNRFHNATIAICAL